MTFKYLSKSYVIESAIYVKSFTIFCYSIKWFIKHLPNPVLFKINKIYKNGFWERFWETSDTILVENRGKETHTSRGIIWRDFTQILKYFFILKH